MRYFKELLRAMDRQTVIRLSGPVGVGVVFILERVLHVPYARELTYGLAVVFGVWYGWMLFHEPRGGEGQREDEQGVRQPQR